MKFKGVLGFIRDVAVSAAIIMLLLVGLFIYTGNWPPLVVIESNSMQHGDDSEVGVIDTGDLVLVKETDNEDDIISYVEGMSKGYKTYSQYGDVIIYRKNNNKDTPVIHRPVLYLGLNKSTDSSFDIPALGKLKYGLDADWYLKPDDPGRWWNLGREFTIAINNYGYSKIEITINLNNIHNKCFSDRAYHSGFVTLGDHNGNSIDQGNLDAGAEKVRPVQPEWIIGKARGELPWMGVAKLWLSENNNPIPRTSRYMFIVVIIAVLCLPIVISFIASATKKAIKGRKKDDQAESEDAGAGEREFHADKDGPPDTIEVIEDDPEENGDGAGSIAEKGDEVDNDFGRASPEEDLRDDNDEGISVGRRSRGRRGKGRRSGRKRGRRSGSGGSRCKNRRSVERSAEKSKGTGEDFDEDEWFD